MLLLLNEFDRILICWPNVLEFGALVRELIDRLNMLSTGRLTVLLGTRLVIALLELILLVIALLELLLLLGARLVIALLELLLLLGDRLVMDLLDELLLELILLGALLTDDRLELLLDETLLERLDDDLLDEELAAEDDFED